MLNYLLLALGFCGGFWFLKSKRKTFYKLALYSVSLLNVMMSNEPEELKIKKVEKGTGKLVVALMLTIANILLTLFIGITPYFLSEYFSVNVAITIPSSFGHILAISIGATIPFLFKTKNKSEYSELAQLFHRLVLNNYTLGLKLFRRELKLNQKKNIKPKLEFVIVTGLARAGTTSLMNHLAGIPTFSSLNYANMPLLMAPNTWAKFYKPKSKKLKERSHNDGIKIGLESNEALEEYFFKAISNDSFINDQSLTAYTLSNNDHDMYLKYQTLVRANAQSIYLAKNNNFLLRYKSLRSLNSQFVAIVMIREPLAHAASLLEKHIQYTQMQNEDDFVLEYMNWLGHHEFGNNQKIFDFKQNKQALPNGNKTKINYWISVWLNYYQMVNTISDNKVLMVDYNEYCDEPNRVLNKVKTIFN
ncbi:MAG: sulfotransferase family protein, partial [Bacteroidia bacterium]